MYEPKMIPFAVLVLFYIHSFYLSITNFSIWFGPWLTAYMILHLLKKDKICFGIFFFFYFRTCLRVNEKFYYLTLPIYWIISEQIFNFIKIVRMNVNSNFLTFQLFRLDESLKRQETYALKTFKQKNWIENLNFDLRAQ